MSLEVRMPQRGARPQVRVLGLVVVAVLLASTSGDYAPAGDPATPPSAEPSRIVLTPTTQPRTSQAFAWTTGTGLPGRVQVRQAEHDAVREIDADHEDVSFPGWDYRARRHTAVVRGLRVDTRYRYRVGSEHRWSRWYGFDTAHDGKRPWTFAYFGDAQQGLADRWVRTVEAALGDSLGRPATWEAADLAVHTGDLVDEPGDDGQWSAWFDALGTQPRTTDTISAVGNHELRSDPSAVQYRSHFRFPPNGPRDETTFSVDYQGVRFIVLDSNHFDDPAQRRFLADRLRTSGSRWTVVAHHLPMFSAVVGRDSDPQRDAWLDTLERHGADLVLQGHEHAYARGYVRGSQDRGEARRPMYVVSVAGGKFYELDSDADNDWTDHGARRVTAAARTPTYQLIRVTRDSLVYRAVVSVSGPGGTAGSTLDTFRLRRP